jgi:hypothetical protein
LLRFFIFGATNWVTMWYSPRGSHTPDQIADAFWELVAHGVAAGGQGGRDVAPGLREAVAIEPMKAG